MALLLLLLSFILPTKFKKILVYFCLMQTWMEMLICSLRVEEALIIQTSIVTSMGFTSMTEKGISNSVPKHYHRFFLLLHVYAQQIMMPMAISIYLLADAFLKKDIRCRERGLFLKTTVANL